MSKVLLYVYDLSGGLARQLSLPLTGKYIEGIWHTSVVVYGREVYYGQGILESVPGMTHHGKPVKQIECGTTEIPEEMFDEYLADLRASYTAAKYHLLDFNCNTFTADVVGFLTGSEIPEWITNLPTEFLSTPFGQSLRPQIDRMFGGSSTARPATTAPRTDPQAAATLQSALAGNPALSGLASSLLNGVASQSYNSSSGTATPPQQSITSSLSSSLSFCSNLASFTSTLHYHGMTFTLFTSKGDIITRQVQMSFEQIAQEERRRRQAGNAGGKNADLAFVEVDVDMPSGKLIADKYGVSDTPGYAFFKGDEMVLKLGKTPSTELREAVRRQIQAFMSS